MRKPPVEQTREYEAPIVNETIAEPTASRNKAWPDPPKLVVLLAVGGIAVAALLVAGRLGMLEWAKTTFSSVEDMRTFVSGYGPWAPAVFFLAQTLQVILAPIPGGVTVVVGTLLFGFRGGLVLSVAGAVVGSATLFVAVRLWGRPLALRLVGRENYDRYVSAFDEGGALLFVVLLVPFMPDDVVCALAGLSAVSFRRFVVLVAVGRTPSWALTALIAADLATRSAAVWTGAVLAVVAVLALGVWHRRRLEGWLLKLTDRGPKV